MALPMVSLKALKLWTSIASIAACFPSGMAPSSDPAAQKP